MATRKDIITLPHDNLRKRSQRVAIVTPEIEALIKKMEAATLDWEDHRKHEVGVALAAVQVNSLKRIIIVRNNFDNKEDRSFSVLINPEITKYEGEVVAGYEGCLSVKDMYGEVPRHNKVRLKAMDVNGKIVRIKAEGFLARVLQHEVDHTKGKMFIDHIKDAPEAFFILNNDGKLEPLDFEDIKSSKALWE